MTPAPIEIRFGTAVRQRRERLGISQEELARRAGLHRAFLSDIERGLRNASLRTVEKIAAGLLVPLETLIAEAAPARSPAGRIRPDPGKALIASRGSAAGDAAREE